MVLADPLLTPHIATPCAWVSAHLPNLPSPFSSALALSPRLLEHRLFFVLPAIICLISQQSADPPLREILLPSPPDRRTSYVVVL
ncbi:hypothetical protein BJX68DRAFT_44692 [Aspergillus pseudodeflectus]|uniref:Uncharacterized protein n=1 Tax=Aspergillus pseudodeflectus TaxID=176178 RepID=A0ABR4KMY9_9EURO